MGLFGLFKNKKKENKSNVAKEPVKATETKAEKVEEPAPAAPEKATKTEVKAEVKAENKAPARKPAEEKPAPAEKAAPVKTASAEKPAPAVKAAPDKTESAEKPAPAAKAAPAKEEPAEAQAPVTNSADEDYTGRFEINKSKDGKKYFFNLYASNKVGIATSQMYASAQSALGGIKSVIANAEKAPVEDQSLKSYNPEDALPYPKWEIYIDNGGKYRFRLNASNGSCVCHSQGYTTKAACKNGIESIIRSSKNPEIDKAYISKEDK